MKTSKNKFIIVGLFLCALSIGMYSCSDLEDTPIDRVADISFLSPDDMLDEAYSYMYVYPSSSNAFALNELSTDELQYPFRGADWGDEFVRIHDHRWNDANNNIVGSWEFYNKGHALANEVLANTNSSISVKSQARFLRAYYMYHIMDLFGQVPFKDDKGSPIVFSRAQACDKIIDELEAVIPSLDVATTPPSQKIVATKEAAQALLAKIYLNKGVYTAANVSATYSFTADDMDKVISYCDVLINSNKFALTDKYFDNFAIDNDAKSKELVFNIPYTAGINPSPNGFIYGSNQQLVYMSTHYNQNPSGWNGFNTLSDFYNKFEPNDKRLGGDIIDSTQSGLTNGFLIGQQYDKNGKKLKTRYGTDLIFTPDCPLYGAQEAKGIRIVKFQPDFDNPVAGANDFGFIRYADVLLMKAEALFRKGNTSDAIMHVNQVRKARGLKDLATLTNETLLDERGKEFYYEGWRRNDLIRFEKFNDPVQNRPNASPVTRRLFPIPPDELGKNPLLKQNEGY
jgi:hypothetical protein